jgi:dTDP-D-glucose 4,6-dehydratase
MLMVKKYPQYKIVNFDKLDYCSSLVNIKEIASYPNYVFVKVCERAALASVPATALSAPDGFMPTTACAVCACLPVRRVTSARRIW